MKIKRVVILTIAALLFTTTAWAAQYQLKSETLPVVGSTAVRITSTVNTWATSVLFQPHISHPSAIMRIGDSGVTTTHGIRIVHSQSLAMDAPSFSGGTSDVYDLFNFWAICGSEAGADFSTIANSCSLTFTFPVQE